MGDGWWVVGGGWWVYIYITPPSRACAGAPRSTMAAIGMPTFFYGAAGGSAAHFQSALQHESVLPEMITDDIVIKFTFFFRRIVC